jgi:hypothetical protein
MTVTMPKLASTRRIGSTVLATIGATAAAVALAAPAHASVTQKCIQELGQYTLCVSFNTDGNTAAANVQNRGGTVTVDLHLQNANGVDIVSGRKAIGNGAWYGIYKSGVANTNYCAYSAMAGGQRVCLR